MRKPCFLALAGAFIVAAAQAATTFTVTSILDPGNGVCTAATVGDGCTLREAIAAANSVAGDDTITFAAGVTGIIQLTAVLPDLTTNMSMTGPGASLLTVRRSAGSSYRVFHVTATGFATFSGMTISDGTGGIINDNPAALTVTDCVISGNSTVGGLGGAIYNNSTGPVTVSNTTMSGNSAGRGGALFNNSTAPVTITNCTFSNNLSNGSSTVGGGGIYNNSTGTVNMTNSRLAQNRATASGANSASGGGIFSASGGLNVANTTLSNNSTFAINSGSARGAGIFVNTGTVNLTNSTLSGNFCSGAPSPMMFGGGIFNAAGTVNVKSTIIALSTLVAQDGTQGSNPDASGPFTSQGFNLIGKRDGSTGFTQSTDQTGTVAAPLDPKLDGRRDNGGPTLTIALLPGSPAIDKGTSQCLTCGLTGVLTTDQRVTGFPRTIGDPRVPNAAGGDGTDIGAFELQTVSSTLANISTRLAVQTGDNVLIGGFSVTGTQPKKVIVHAIGPSLPFGGTLANPILELHGPNGLIDTNDDWKNSPNKQAIIDSGLSPSNDLESAIVQTLPANGTGYTAIVRGVNNGTGIGVVDAFDLNATVDSTLANISTRGLVQTGDNILIAGTIILGQNAQKVIVRAIGPSLSQFFAGTLAN